MTSSLNTVVKCVKGLLFSSLFHVFRTEATLGYIVQVTSSARGEGCHLNFVVGSDLNNVDAHCILSSMTAYFSALETSLDTICSKETVEEMLKASIRKLQELTLSVAMDFSELLQRYHNPNRFRPRERELEATKFATVGEERNFMRRLVVDKRECTGLASVIDRWGDAEAVLPSWTAVGEHHMPIFLAKKMGT